MNWAVSAESGYLASANGRTRYERSDRERSFVEGAEVTF